ncbi:hypothetical protein CDD83_455 [Cordyceps sp. RAO-2017]|nr:hypothetical protein CDD83_455 [Cordyceps sp. RAO-2017]
MGGVGGLAKTVAVRDSSSSFSCTVGIGSDAWDRLVPTDGEGGRGRRPAELRPFRAVSGAAHTAPSTPGDLLFHIRSDRRDVCFEFERLLMRRLGDAVAVEDLTVGFRYFDLRDLLGFVDGTANPVGPALPASVLVAAQDVGDAAVEQGQEEGADDDEVRQESAAAVGGSYVVVQKYLHDLAAWEKLPAEAQEAIIGRTKLDNVELEDAAAGEQKSHKTLATIEDAAGREHDILRDNMPFGSPGEGQFGTYFIGYSRRLWVIERMLRRMFVGDPPGLHDRILDYSTAATGAVFFVPSAALLASLGDD